jgi:hypothetical protein
MRNPSKNTIKKLSRPANGQPGGWGQRHTNYWFFNEVGARAFVISKGKIEHRRAWSGFFLKYLTPAQRLIQDKLKKQP